MYELLLKLAMQGKFTERLRNFVVRGIGLGIYTEVQLQILDQTQLDATLKT